MLRGPLFLVKKYLKPQFTLISVLTYLSFLGPVIGVSILIFVSSIMNGFPKKVIESIKNTEASITLSYRTNQSFKYSRFIKDIMKDFESPASASPSGTTPIFIQFEKTEQIRGFRIKGFLPKKDHSSLKDKIVQGRYELKSNEVLISSDIADQQGLEIGDKIFIHSPRKYASLIKTVQKDNKKANEITLDLAKELRIAGFFNFSYSEYDFYLVFTHLDTFNDLINLSWGRSRTIDIWLENPDNVDGVIQKLENMPKYQNLNFISWKEKKKGFYELVQTEKGMVLFALSFIMLAAAAAIAVSILSFILKKVKDIGILKALGVSSIKVAIIFLVQGLIMGIISSSIGLGIGLLMVEKREVLLQIFEYITKRTVLPKSAYFFDTLPAYINYTEVMVIYFASIIICILATLVPSVVASKIKPHTVIKTD